MNIGAILIKKPRYGLYTESGVFRNFGITKYQSMTNIEIWKDIPSFEGIYQISNFGNVKSLNRIVKNGVGYRNVRERILKPGIGTKGKIGYYLVILSINQKHTIKYIHRLVASVFLGESNLCVNHKDGNSLNNHVDNLEWVTISENNRHSREVLNNHGYGCLYGKDNPMYGKKHKPESIKKMVESRRKRSCI